MSYLADFLIHWKEYIGMFMLASCFIIYVSLWITQLVAHLLLALGLMPQRFLIWWSGSRRRSHRSLWVGFRGKA